MSEKKHVKSVVRQEDLAIAVAAARTAWVMTGISRADGEIHLVTESRDPRGMSLPGSPLRTRQCGSATGPRYLCVN